MTACKSTAWLLAGLSSALWIVACSSNDARTGMTLSIERRTLVGETPCFATCPDSPLADPRLSERCEDLDLEFEVPSCGFRGGEDLIRASISYDAAVSASANLESPVLTLIADNEVLRTETGFDFPVQPPQKGEYWPVAVKRFRAPILETTQLALRGTVPERVAVEEGPYSITVQRPVLSIVECPEDDECQLPSGAGSVTLELVAAVGFAGKTFAVTTFVQDVPQSAGAPQAIDLRAAGELARGLMRLPVADGIGKTWRIVATLDAQRVETSARLRAAALPNLSVASAGQTPQFEGEEPPARSVGEPAAECRRYRIGIHVPDAPDSAAVELATTSGTLGGNGTKQIVGLDAQGLGYADLQLGQTATSDAVSIAAVVDPKRSTELTLLLTKVLPLQGLGTLVSPTPLVRNAATGTPDGVRLRGLVRTVRGAAFSPNFSVGVGVRVLSTAAIAACSPVVDAAAVACDPDAPDPRDRGGCLLFDAAAPVRSDGIYDLVLNRGICFGGQIEVVATSPVLVAEPSAGQCVGEVPATPNSVVVGSTTLTLGE
jgi:hypothetical protein